MSPCFESEVHDLFDSGQYKNFVKDRSAQKIKLFNEVCFC